MNHMPSLPRDVVEFLQDYPNKKADDPSSDYNVRFYQPEGGIRSKAQYDTTGTLDEIL
jgi:hypothetical protein